MIQFTVKHEQNIDCGGGYVKVFDCSLKSEEMHGESPYLVMFGPDICGPGTKKVHAILSYNGKNVLINKEVRCKDDVYTHAYTFVIKPDNTYEILIDGEKVESGELEADWDLLPPKNIKVIINKHHKVLNICHLSPNIHWQFHHSHMILSNNWDE